MAPKKGRKYRPQSGWKRPTADERSFAVRSIAREKAIPKEFLDDDEGSFFQKIVSPKRGDWLDEHDEKGQTFMSFKRQSMRATPHAHVQVIELVPLGPFPQGTAPELSSLEQYTAVFFGCSCRIGKPLKVSSCMDQARSGEDGQLQLCVGSIFNVLNERKTARDVLCQVAITMVDLYPIIDGEAWNFVYGQAMAMDGVGVFSFARYTPDGDFVIPWISDAETAESTAYDEYQVDRCTVNESKICLSSSSLEHKEAEEGGAIISHHVSLMLYRSCKVLTHEIGHLFGIRHCIFYECLLSGCNHLSEFDFRPLHLCPVDLRKLQEATGFSVPARYEALLGLAEQWGEAWEGHADWLRRRLDYLQRQQAAAL